MKPSIPILKAARILNEGGVIAYPTEGIYGLGCRPDREDAVRRVLDIKQRDPSMGLVLIASRPEQLEEWAVLPDAHLASDAERPVTWIVEARPAAPELVRGRHTGIAIRITAHPVAAALCDATDSALVSTSANLTGRQPTRNPFVLRRHFGRLVDYVVPGSCGPAKGASEIRDYASGRILRPADDQTKPGAC